MMMREKAPRRGKDERWLFLLLSRVAPPFECARFNPTRVSRRSNDSLFLFIPVYLPLTRTRNHQIVNQRLDRSPGKRDVDDFSRHSTERAGELGE